MTYYHQSKQGAQDASRKFTDSGMWDARFQLEPYNGWVVVLSPATLDVFQYALAGILDEAELDLGTIRRRPATYKRPPEVEQVRAQTKKRAAPPPPPPNPPVAAAPPPPPPPPPRS